uniref:Uncharacterized protein n=1 Tax=Rhodnius prolixus TaxID=13249 RepID=T1HKT4_RHOPR
MIAKQSVGTDVYIVLFIVSIQAADLRRIKRNPGVYGSSIYNQQFGDLGGFHQSFDHGYQFQGNLGHPYLFPSHVNFEAVPYEVPKFDVSVATKAVASTKAPPPKMFEGFLSF